jgi:hypothetical protein
MSLASIEHKVVNGLELAGKEFVHGLAVVVKYAVPAASLATLFFPQFAAPIAAAVTSVDLIQNAVIEIEQKYAASGIAKSTETNEQKLADVTALVAPTVTALLAAEGIKLDIPGIQAIINAVVAILKVQVVVAPAALVAA